MTRRLRTENERLRAHVDQALYIIEHNPTASCSEVAIELRKALNSDSH